MAVRLNKYLADRGIGARRKCDALIAEGRVSVNGRVVSEAGTKVEERDRVSVDGRPLGGAERHVYYVLNKPVGVITTLEDPEGRRTIKELLPRGARVYPVGRLDADTSGLLLLTNDGELAHHLMHPRYGVNKVYRVRLAQEPRGDQLRRLASGVRFDKDMVSAPARVRRIDPGFDAIMIEVIIHEGRFRQVRRMCEAVGLEVTGLHRVGYGPLRLGPLARGMYRELSEEEVADLRAASARTGGTGRSRAVGRPTRLSSAKPVRPPVAEAPAPSEEENVEEAEVQETWLAGAGPLGKFVDDDEDDDRESPGPGDGDEASGKGSEPQGWPVRPGGRRGDRDWEAAQPAPPRPRRARPGFPAPRAERARPGRPAPRGESARAERRGAAPPRAPRERDTLRPRPERAAAPPRRERAVAPRAERGFVPRAGGPREETRAQRPERGFVPRASARRDERRPARQGRDFVSRESARRGERPAPRGRASAPPRSSGGRPGGFSPRPEREFAPRPRAGYDEVRPRKRGKPRGEDWFKSGTGERRSASPGFSRKGRGPGPGGRNSGTRGRASAAPRGVGKPTRVQTAAGRARPPGRPDARPRAGGTRRPGAPPRPGGRPPGRKPSRRKSR